MHVGIKMLREPEHNKPFFASTLVEQASESPPFYGATRALHPRERIQGLDRVAKIERHEM